MCKISVEIMNWCLDYDYTFVNSLIPWMICKKMEGKMGFAKNNLTFVIQRWVLVKLVEMDEWTMVSCWFYLNKDKIKLASEFG